MVTQAACIHIVELLNSNGCCVFVEEELLPPPKVTFCPEPQQFVKPTETPRAQDEISKEGSMAAADTLLTVIGFVTDRAKWLWVYRRAVWRAGHRLM